MRDFAKALPAIRERVTADLRRRKLSREKVLAVVVELLQTTLIRVGNDSYAKANGTFGLTTMRRKHLELSSRKVIFDFVGKSHKEHHIELRDPKLAHALEQCDDLPGHRLFQYLDEDGTKHPVDSGDVNDYLRNITGQEFTAKDFRTWAGTVIAAIALRAMPEAFDPKAREKQIVDAVKATAAELGNTPATCRKYYIHPLIFETHLGRLAHARVVGRHRSLRR